MHRNGAKRGITDRSRCGSVTPDSSPIAPFAGQGGMMTRPPALASRPGPAQTGAMEETEAVMDAAATKPLGSAKDADASGRGSRPTGAFTEVREDMARFRAGQLARLSAPDPVADGSLDQPGAAFSNPWADFADRHDRPVQGAMIRFQPLFLLVASLAATAALLLLMGAVGPALFTALDVGPAHTVAPGAE